MAAFLSLKKTALLNASNYSVYSYFHSQLPATCVQLTLSEFNNFSSPTARRFTSVALSRICLAIRLRWPAVKQSAIDS